MDFPGGGDSLRPNFTFATLIKVRKLGVCASTELLAKEAGEMRNVLKHYPQDAAMFAARWKTVGLQIRGIAVSIGAAQNYFHLALRAGEPVRRPRSIETRAGTASAKVF